MANVTAILNVATNTSVPGSTPASVTPTPAPDAMTGSAVCSLYGTKIDLATKKVQFKYLAYQTYSTAGGDIGMAQVSGTSQWIDTPDVSVDFPNVNVSGTVTATIASGAVNFVIASTVSYTKSTPGLYTVPTV